VTGNWGEVVTR